MVDWLLILKLFLVFFKIGLFTFGGGYAMIPLIKSEVVTRGWLLEEEVISFIAISESTPGPFALNMATFIGTSQAGILGALTATLGVVLPSFIIILIIAKWLHRFSDNKYVAWAMKGIQPIVVGLIAATAISLIIKNVDPLFPRFGAFNLTSFTLMIDFAIIYFGIRLIRKKPMLPILLIFISAIFGLIVYA